MPLPPFPLLQTPQGKLLAKFKMKGATARFDEPSLCLSCKHAILVRGEKLSQEYVECEALYSHMSPIRTKITSCSAHIDKNHPSLRELEDMAWVLRTDNRTRKIGFVPSKDLKAPERYKLSNDYD